MLSFLHNLLSRTKFPLEVIFSARSGRVDDQRSQLQRENKNLIWETLQYSIWSKMFLMFWCTFSGLVFFPECSPSANTSKKKFFLFLNLKEVCTDKTQPLVENILRSVHPLTDEVDDKLMVGGEQRWMIRSWWQHTNCKNLLYRVKGWCYFRDWVNT